MFVFKEIYILSNKYIMSEDKIVLLKRMLDTAKSAIGSAEELLKDIAGGEIATVTHDYGADANMKSSLTEANIIEGVFDGQKMIGPDKREYPIPANYSSKSKLVAGDMLKLTIEPDGRFKFKQISPVKRKAVIGTLVRDGNQYGILVGDITYKVLLASVTYYRVELGDQVTLLIPENEESEWGAIDAVLPG